MKQIPNLFTLLNLIFGCIAIVYILQTGETIAQLDENTVMYWVLPEKMGIGALFLFAAAVVDFLDGFLARLLKASSGMGEQLDSLSDMVSFGVAPGVILYQLLRMSYTKQDNGLDVTIMALLPAFIFTAAVAWRLAKFNISTTQKYNFEGVPSPAGGLLIASLPLALHYDNESVRELIINRWFLYGIILLVSYLMVSNHSMMAMKFKDYSFRNNKLKFLLAGISLVAIILLKWLAVPVIFVIYVLLSLFNKEPHAVAVAAPGHEEKDITV
ncbi:CDP-alcohol phosphatidyltransferase [Flaviaesturariibacter flavus]|uniref:CDP-alcohol phosphatidyltransferase n=1 Tax=Flaviaesturariibacter flavus TaxID=2502780 RepID=A0A4R1BBX5_9BACT|nr:CDP-alcohol phosphatidyltransferase family protein [Flaviaesturariibacter flavus]TCJ14494.1 CDP-alcohol phosphatidyltransferase [Flaviaesturariibacter flavus]